MYRKHLPILGALVLILLSAPLSESRFVTAQAQTTEPIYFGVIGAPDSPTTLGVTLAVQRVNALGVLTTPDGNTYTLKVATANAANADDVANAITQLKQTNLVALFGPDDDKLLMDSLPALQDADVPVFTGATTTAFKGSGLLVRTRADDSWQMSALAQVMGTDLQDKNIAIYQGSADTSASVPELVNALTRLNLTFNPPVIQQPDGKTADAVNALTDEQPDMIAAFGSAAQVADVYRTLRANNYTGQFATTYAEDTAFIQGLPVEWRAGIYGVTTWSYAWQEPDSETFRSDYVGLFNEVPQALSAAGYDAAVATYFAMKSGGIAPNSLTAALLKLGRTHSLQGMFNPNNNGLSSSTMVVLTNQYGAATVIARFDDTGRLKIIDMTPTALPTATPNGVVATAKGTLNVRGGPGENYDVIGQLRKGDQYQVIGASLNLHWLVINFRDGNGWIIASGVDLFGNLNTLPIVAAPPTPIPSPSPSPQPFADIVLLSATMSPPIPLPSQPFTLYAVIGNNGLANASTFAVATTFQPGNDYSSAVLPGLPAGQQTTISLPGMISTCAVQTVAIVLDLNNQLTNESPEAKANNKPTFSYRIDHAYMAQGHQNITATSSADFDGGGADVSWDGTALTPIGTGKLGVLSGTPFSEVTWCTLTPGTVSSAAISKSALPPGTLVAMYTAEGRRGILHITGYSGTALQTDYYVYNP